MAQVGISNVTGRRTPIKFKYDSEADILMFILQDGFPENAISEPGGVIISYNEAHEPLTIEFLNASQRQWFKGYQNFTSTFVEIPITIAPDKSYAL